MRVVEQASQLLIEAHRDIKAAAVILPTLTTEQAYAVQEQVMHGLGIALTDICCWKVGCASIEAQPIFAPIFPGGVWHQGAKLPAHNYRDLHVELEWGYRLKKSITATDFPTGLEALSEYFSAPFACFELVDSRLAADQFNNSEAKLADNQITAGIVIGDPIESHLLSDPTQVTHELICDGQLLTQNRGGHPLSHPGLALLKGIKCLLKAVPYLPANTMILTGSWNGLIPVTNYSQVSAHFAAQAKVSFKLHRN